MFTAPFKKDIKEFVCKRKPFNFSRMFLIFFRFPFLPFLRSFASHQNTTESIECFLMSYSISGPLLLCIATPGYFLHLIYYAITFHNFRKAEEPFHGFIGVRNR